jgi:uncharacterized protein
MPAASNVLIQFAKIPKPGQVKTRFQPELSPEASGRVALALMKDSLNATASLKGVKRILGCDPTQRDPFFIQLAERYGLQLIDQSGEDLGARMRNAVEEAYRLGFDRAVIVGTDLPTLPVGYVEEAFRLLKKHPLVLGPSIDGGYYLIGCSGTVPPIFDGIDWGTGRVLTQTLRRINRNRLKAALLPFWYDVDTVGDLRFLSQHLACLKRGSGTSAAPETARVLKTLKLDDS